MDVLRTLHSRPGKKNSTLFFAQNSPIPFVEALITRSKLLGRLAVVAVLWLVSFSQLQAQNDTFFYISDGTDELYTINRNTGAVTLIGPTNRTAIEAIAYYPVPGSQALYAADAGDFGELNLSTGNFTLIGEIDGGGTADGAAGPQTLNDVDGLMLDGQSLIMWAVERKGSGPDLLFQIDITTGLFVADAFGTDVDYLQITGDGIDVDVDDLAVDPTTGEIYGVSNNSGVGDVLFRVNRADGQFEFVATLDQDDVEGISFNNDGGLYGSEGDGDNRLSLINPATGAMTNFFSFTGSDVEGLAALVADGNLISGTVFNDTDLDGINDLGETGIAGVTVFLYVDNNGDGQVDPEDNRIQSTTTDSNGDYSFFYLTTGNLLTTTEFSSYPSGFSLTTDNVETMTFTDGVNFGESDSGNDFGLATGVDCDGDGLSDFFEGTGDADGDGIENRCDLDSDNDGILDSVEGPLDFDDDGIPNYLDFDSDDDGIPDAIEANGGVRPTEYIDANGNMSGTDSDGNGIIDTRETSAGSGVMLAPNPDSDNDTYLDYLDLDSDNDGILDLIEAGASSDTDGDGQVDGFTDTNGNGYDDNLESNPLVIPNTDVFYENSNSQSLKPNYIDIDSDADGIDDTREGFSTTDYAEPAIVADTDQDGIIDFFDISVGNDPIDPVDTDSDGTPDYIDLNSDNDAESDFIEGNDADFNGAADVANTGLDANGNGLDDAFDADCGAIETSSVATSYGEEDSDAGNIDIGSSDLELVNESENQVVGVFFPSINVDPGATVSSAYVQFQTDEVTTGAITLTIQGELSTSPATFVATTNNVLNRLSSSTTATQSWTPPDWNTVGEAGADQQTSDISAIIQELIDQGGWTNGSDIVLLFTGPTGNTRTAENNPTLVINVTGGTAIICFSNVSLPDENTNGEFDFRDDSGVPDPTDTDGDGVPDLDDIDDDNDGILDTVEGAADFDSDGIINSLDVDSDNDGIPDIIEAGGVDTDNDGRVDTATDTDGDGWANTFDSDNGGTALVEPDTDGDGFKNYVDLDSDGDGIVDLIESQTTTGTPVIPTGTDTDADGYDDAFDDDNGGTPTVPVDTESDGTEDYLDDDSDNDGFPDYIEAYDTDGDFLPNTVATGSDADQDGLDNAFDTVTGPNATTNAYNNEDALDFPDVTTSGQTSERDWREDNAIDSDGDGQINSIDIDDDNDGILDVDEGIIDTDGDGIPNSLDLDSDSDGIPDIIEAGGVDTDNDGRVDDNTDTDNDGWADTFDSDNGGTALANADTDSDGLQNFLDIDADGDGIVDLIEAQNTTIAPIVPSGSDTDSDGIDDAFDVNCTPCGAVTGVPAAPADTDMDTTPDYLDINSDDDDFQDVLEAHDTDGDLTADTTPSGNDADGDGLDDAFDQIVGPNSTTNAANNETAFSFPDVTTSGDSERDWRESNLPDADLDGVPDDIDIDDDNDGILDVDEGASTDTDGDGIVDRLDLDSDQDGIPDIIEAGGVDSDNDGRVDDDTDTDGDGWANTFDSDNGGTALTNADTDADGINNYRDLDSDNDGIEDIIEAGGTDADDDGRADTVNDIDQDGWLDIFDSDNGGTALAVGDFDNDGLENYIDIDADGDGIVDLIESQATTGTPIIPVGTDTDGDGIDNAFDSDNSGTPITPVDTDTDLSPDYLDLNSDGDTFLDILEGYDTNGDQVADTSPSGFDSDGDGLDNAFDLITGPNSTTNVYNNQDANDFPDVTTSGLTSERDWREQNTSDTDLDGIPDATDIDDDNDGILDVDEGELTDTDGDGIVNSLDLDSDNDGIPDILEAGGVDTDFDGRVDDDTDTDGDGWANTFDSDNGGTALADPDSDNDGVNNYLDRDSDQDGILDVIEAGYTDANGDGEIDSFTDNNGNGWQDTLEGVNYALPNTDLAEETTNGQSLKPNYIDIDSDGDAIDDTREGYSTAAYQFPSSFTDTDGDGILDFWDVNSSNSPIAPVDTDSDGLDDYVDLNSDNDSRTDFVEGNDFNRDDIADVANSGLDANNNGLDDAFDASCYGDVINSTATDYGEELNSTGAVNLTSTDLELIDDGGLQTVGILFPGISISPGSTVNSATIQFQADETDAGANTVTIQGELSTSPAAFTTTTNDVTDRTTTTASESWVTPDWNTVGEAGADQRTVDISSIIQEIINQGGWTSGNSIVIIFSGSGSVERTAEVNPTITINVSNTETSCASDISLPNSDGDSELDFRDTDGTTSPTDTDQDGVPDSIDIDDDNDGILDVDESEVLDTDNDGIVNSLDIDADGDGIVDLIESQATTGTPVIPLGVDTDGDGLDDAFDGDCAPCGGITGVPTVVVDTDLDTTPDYLDFNSDNDGLSDAIEGYDTNGDLVAEITPSGTDTDGDGLDDAYDTVSGPNSTNNVYNSEDALDFPDVTTSGLTTERDWREENDLDSDGDGILDINDIDDDNDGILDTVEEMCVTTATGPSGPIVASAGTGGSLTSINDGDLTADNGVALNMANEFIVIDLNNTVPSGTDIVFTLWKNNDNNKTLRFAQLTGPTESLGGGTNPSTIDDTAIATGASVTSFTYTLDADTRYVQVEMTSRDAGRIEVVEATVQTYEICDDDNDGDGIIDSLDLDSDNDGIPDIIEAGGVDSNNDGRVDDNTDTDGDGWANTFDSDNGGNALADPDTDNDGVNDLRDLDSDNDGIEDIIEAGGVDTNDDGVVDTATDSDGDGWANTFDSDNGGTVLANSDTDGDGLANNLDIDADGDGIVDLIESQATTGTPIIPTGTDTDEDGIDDAFDSDNGGTPVTPEDTDNDMTPDYLDLNSDDDSFLDALEGYDTDGDLVANTTPAGTDTDGDGLDDNYDTVVGPNSTTNVYNNEDANDFPDVTTSGQTSERDWRELNVIDTDLDGIPDATDIDDDNDGVLDTDEGEATDTDNDGIVNSLDLDSDNDGIPDIIEAGGVDTDNDGRVDDNTDTDGDGWANTFDSDNGGTALTDPNTDGGSLENRIDIDSDDDGIPDLIEAQATTGSPVLPVGTDTDADGIDDAFDVDCTPCGAVTGVPVSPVDTDMDTTEDYIDTDADNDGLNDVVEGHDTDGDFTPETTPSGTDADNDGLDDAFDLVSGPNSTTNNYNSQNSNNFPDVSTSDQTTERDWRESNETTCDPGGIDSNILLWLRADDGGTAWKDVSNNFVTTTAVGGPTSGVLINFNPSNYLGGVNYYATNLSINADTRPDLAVIAVYQPAVNNSGSVWGEDNGGFDRYVLDASGAGENEAVSNGTSFESDVTGLYTPLETTLSSIIFDEDQSNGSTVFLNGQSTLSFTADHGGETSNNLQIGANGDGGNRFDGVIAEFIVYSQLLNTGTTRQQIEGYLALKYGITLSANTDGDGSSFEAGEGDYIASDGSTIFWDASDYMTHHNNVAGIGRDDNSCLNQLQSMSNGSDAIVAIGLDSDTDGLEASNSLNGSSFGTDLSVLMWGHDGAVLSDQNNREFDSQVNSRLNREWRVSETNNVGTVTVRFDVSNILGPDNSLGTNDESQIVLMVDQDGDFTTTDQIILPSFEIADDGFVSFQVNFTDGAYFTLGSSEQYALPITLLSFTANASDDQINLVWETISEENNSYFRLERSANGLDFETLGFVDGAGTSNVLNTYSFTDEEPLTGDNYYRLVDVDFNGEENYSEVIREAFHPAEINIIPYPNPVRRGEAVYIDLATGMQLETLQVINMKGVLLPVILEEGVDRVAIRSREWVPGIYIIRALIGGQQVQTKLMVID